MNDKYVEKPIDGIEKKYEELLKPPNFDTQTKVDSTNKLVHFNK